MRIPMSNICRAFPELDRYSDKECEALLRQLWRGRLGRRLMFAVVIVVAWTVVWLVMLFGINYVSQWIVVPDWLIFPIIGITVIFALPFMVAFLLRDRIVRRELSRRVMRGVCSCGYSLIGLSATAGRVRCPECGIDFVLADHGLTESDLLPIVMNPESEAAGIGP